MPLESGHGVDFIIETSMSAESGTITLCHIGPLTNIGTALVKEPRIAGHIREIVLMGGTRAEVGNITPSAEYNIYVDPEAAEIVLKSGIAITIAPLDVTGLVLGSRERLARFASLGNRTGAVIAGLLDFSQSLDLADGAGSARHCGIPARSPIFFSPSCSRARWLTSASRQPAR